MKETSLTQGMAYTNEHVLEGWEKYVAALSANDDVGEYNDNFKAEIYQELTQLLAHPPQNEVIFTEEEVAEVVESPITRTSLIHPIIAESLLSNISKVLKETSPPPPPSP